MTWRALALIALAAGACARPRVGDCQVTCASDLCPEGLMCSAGLCRAPEAVGTACPGDADAAVCPGWSFAPSNLDPCDLPAAAGEFLPDSGTWRYDTALDVLFADDGSTTTAPFPSAVVQQ